MDFFLEFLAEFLIQFIFELLGALLDGSLDLSSRSERTAVKVSCYLILGVALARCSVAVWPHPILGRSLNPFISLALAPFAATFSIVFVSKVIEQKWNFDIETSQVSYSFFFAFVIAITRFVLIY